MTVLLQRLVEYAWVFYIVCVIGALFYTVRALSAHRERNLALFTLERETATSRIVRAWAMVLVFVAIGASIFVSVTLVLPGLPLEVRATPPSVGLDVPTPSTTPTPTPTPGLEIPTLDASTREAIPTSPPPDVTDTPSPATAVVPAGAVSGQVNVRFGNFVELVSYGLPSAQVTAGQSLELTLNWRALETPSPMDYLVFTHLRGADGNIIAQHDGPPGQGTRPMTEWAPGEVIADVHLMSFQEAYRDYVGPATIAVGLYNPSVVSERVPTSEGETLVVLPLTVQVVAQ